MEGGKWEKWREKLGDFGVFWTKCFPIVSPLEGVKYSSEVSEL